MAVEFFRTFSDYDRQAAEARRRRAMADLLAQQVAEPTDYGRGPTPAAAPLVQGLQAFMAARAAKKAGEAEEAATKAGTQEARDFLRVLTEPEKKLDVGQAAVESIKQMGTPELVDGRLEYRKTAMPAPTPEMIPQTGPQVQLGRKPEDDQIYMPTAMGRETDPQRIAALLANPQMKAGFTDEQRRSLALEGMLTSQNPLLQKVAGAIYPTLQAKKPELQIGAIDPAKFTPQSLAAAIQSGDVSKLQAVSTPVANEIGKPSFENFTVASLEKYKKTGNLNDLVEKPKPVGAAKVDKGPSESTLWRAEDKLRGDFEQITAPFRTQLAETQKITDIFQNYGNNPKAIEAIPQQSLVILLNKFLDPTSVVREGEFNRVVEAQGLEARARNYLSRLMEGKPLDVSAINQIAELAKLYERAADEKIRQYANEYSAIAEVRGLDIGSVITNPNYRPRQKIADEDVEIP